MSYRTNPEWLAARAELVRDMAHDETPTSALMRRLAAIDVMSTIELADEVAA